MTTCADPWLAALRERRPIDQPVALVVAHPDDETLAAGGSLHLFRNLLLIHVTDGAPRTLSDASREGFDSPAAYATAREAELAAALRRSDAAPVRISLGIVDQEASRAIGPIAARLHTLFRSHRVGHVLTHTYEGGHPDHDAVACAVARAVSSAGDAALYEFAGYHAAPDGGMRVGAFLAPKDDTVSIRLQGADLERKRAMLACFDTQRDILSRFDPAVELIRPAPAHEFHRPPHPGALLYERWGWMSGTAWRGLAQGAACVV